VVARDGKNCRYCGVETTTPRYSGDNSDCVRTLDHIVPLSRGGTNRLSNLVIACGWCNRMKADGQFSAQAIEARRAETGTGSVHESAVGEAEAPDQGPDHVD